MVVHCLGWFLSVGSFGLSYNDYDNWNTNTNCSSHLCKFYNNAHPAHIAKNKLFTRFYSSISDVELFKAKAMKRIGNIYHKIYTIENLMLADAKASKGKQNQYGVQVHNQSKESNLLELQNMLINKTYKTSPYTTFKVFEPKERDVYRLP